MISLWITVGLIISAVCVGALGAFFSIVGLGALFSGATLAVWVMAGSLEFSKFTLAAYLHQVWGNLNKIYRTYLVFSVVVLSIITSVGIFGFLSEAYQSASIVLETETTKLENIKNQKVMIANEIARLNKGVDEIPDSRISKKLRARAEAEPAIKELNKKLEEAEQSLASANLMIIEVKKKVGPLIYISRALNKDIDSVVKYLILIFVSVFDPLAICLVIASTQAIESRRHGKHKVIKSFAEGLSDESEISEVQNNKTKLSEVKSFEKVSTSSEIETAGTASQESVADKSISDDVVVQMNFKDEDKVKKVI